MDAVLLSFVNLTQTEITWEDGLKTIPSSDWLRGIFLVKDDQGV